ncbi:hypothetical protein BpHYR1_023261 [Brachionus plicatilis]|uniref:Uncharacterized protein n=1 Tax=Brachionus plicatilis TaxID=10195 RepID=A0A3M7RUF1_BRAPC|nr:hypothetical protein BpHYR1_023261 [Brachionus plicatilis]
MAWLHKLRGILAKQFEIEIGLILNISSKIEKGMKESSVIWFIFNYFEISTKSEKKDLLEGESKTLNDICVLDAGKTNRSITRTVFCGHLANQLGGLIFVTPKQTAKYKRTAKNPANFLVGGHLANQLGGLIFVTPKQTAKYKRTAKNPAIWPASLAA